MFTKQQNKLLILSFGFKTSRSVEQCTDFSVFLHFLRHYWELRALCWLYVTLLKYGLTSTPSVDVSKHSPEVSWSHDELDVILDLSLLLVQNGGEDFVHVLGQVVEKHPRHNAQFIERVRSQPSHLVRLVLRFSPGTLTNVQLTHLQLDWQIYYWILY